MSTHERDDPSDAAERARQHRRELNARYRQREKERREADPELREAWLERKREEGRRAAARKSAAEARRTRDRERSKAWAEANRERLTERNRKWVSENRDAVRKSQLAYYYRNHEAELEAMRDRAAEYRKDPARRAKHLQYQRENRDRINAQQRARKSTPEGRERHLQWRREWDKRERRRRELGLPPRKLRKATINERTRNEIAATDYFTKKRSNNELVRLDMESMVPGTIDSANQTADRAARIKPFHEALARAFHRRLLAEFLTSPKGQRLREDVRMDSIARQLRGMRPYPDLDIETQRRAVLMLTVGTGREEHKQVRPGTFNANAHGQRTTSGAGTPGRSHSARHNRLGPTSL